jgi:hypothetical protein
MQTETFGFASRRSGLKWDRFGNVSVRDGVSRNFYITGSATGGLPKLSLTDCVRVVDYDFKKNWLRYEGNHRLAFKNGFHERIPSRHDG